MFCTVNYSMITLIWEQMQLYCIICLVAAPDILYCNLFSSSYIHKNQTFSDTFEPDSVFTVRLELFWYSVHCTMYINILFPRRTLLTFDGSEAREALIASHHSSKGQHFTKSAWTGLNNGQEFIYVNRIEQRTEINQRNQDWTKGGNKST